MKNCGNIGDISYTLLNYKDKNARGRVYQVYAINTFGLESIREKFSYENKQWTFRHLLIEKNVRLKETLLMFEDIFSFHLIMENLKRKIAKG